MTQPILQPPPRTGNDLFDRYMLELYRRLFLTGIVNWASIDKTGSSLSDITTRSHTQLTDIGSNTHPTIDATLAELVAYRSTTVTITVTETDRIIQVLAACTINLPSVTTLPVGKIYIIDNNHGGNTTIDPYGSETIETAATKVLVGQIAAMIYSDGTAWRVI